MDIVTWELLSYIVTTIGLPLAILVFWIGLFPDPFLTKMHASVDKLLGGGRESVQTAPPSGHAAVVFPPSHPSGTR